MYRWAFGRSLVPELASREDTEDSCMTQVECGERVTAADPGAANFSPSCLRKQSHLATPR